MRLENKSRFWRRLGIAQASLALLSACTELYPEILQKLLSDFDLAAAADLATSKTLAKMGPMLGLMGTLIPMGPALVGLSTGDIASMAYNMQVAFATTVVGLFSAAIGFITGQVKTRWYRHDSVNLQFLADLLVH